MRDEAMERLDVLVGSWRTTMRNAWFLEPADRRCQARRRSSGSATRSWSSAGRWGATSERPRVRWSWSSAAATRATPTQPSTTTNGGSAGSSP